MDEKKKIGILTFHNAHNYGAVLQAYALKTKLNRMGYKAKILNYQNPYIARLYRKGIHIDFWKRDILPSRWGKVFHEVGDVYKRQIFYYYGSNIPISVMCETDDR